MEKLDLTQEQAKKFAQGFNKKVSTWNSDASDQGKSPFRASTWADLGYGYARAEIVRRQQAGELNIKLEPINVKQANTLWMAN